MILRPYQISAIDSARQSVLAGHRRIVLVAPTGAGKTQVAVGIARGSIERGNRVLFMAHREELVSQASKRLDSVGIDHGIIMADNKRVRPDAPVQVGSIQTLVRRKLPDAEVVILDECHHGAANSFRKILLEYPDSFHIGLTATPYRLDGQGLGFFYTDLIEVTTIEDLINEKLLVQPREFAPSSPDMSKVHVTAGDFNEREAAAVMMDTVLIGDIVSWWKKLAEGRITVCFATSIAHSRAIMESFRDAGVPAGHIDGEMPKQERRQVLEDLHQGRITLLSNCNIVTEGWDLPECSAVILARPTLSKSLYKQMVGRGIRGGVEGKADCIVLDHADNCRRHGLVTDRETYTLDGIEKRDKKAEAGVKTCKRCYAIVPSDVEECPECGYEFEPTARRPIPKQRDGDLIELRKAPPPSTDDRAVKFLARCVASANLRGWKTGAAFHRFRDRYDRWPTDEEKRAAYRQKFPDYLVDFSNCPQCGSGFQIVNDGEFIVACRSCRYYMAPVPPEFQPLAAQRCA